jgi:hypothetical protein
MFQCFFLNTSVYYTPTFLGHFYYTKDYEKNTIITLCKLCSFLKFHIYPIFHLGGTNVQKLILIYICYHLLICYITTHPNYYCRFVFMSYCIMLYYTHDFVTIIMPTI